VTADSRLASFGLHGQVESIGLLSSRPNRRFNWWPLQGSEEGEMPLARISLREGTTEEYRKGIADGVHQAMIDALGIPPKDRFQVISEYKAGGLIYDAEYLDIKRSDMIVFVQITLSTGRKPGQKRALFARMAELLGKSPGVRPEDLLVNLVEVSWENWSFGKGEAQYQKD
jgi:phenylpyruvate tautomerase PptA (4-oxalocrotonate tautomerase family)